MAASSEPCLQLGQISGWNVADDDTLIVRESQREQYKVTLMGHCTGLHYVEDLAFKSHSDFSCMTPGDSITFLRTGMRQQCTIKSIESYVPEKKKDEAAEAAQPE